MKLCKLKLKNLNSFRKEIEIDFEKSPLSDASLVAITGPTGAGKTTLLDAVCVALYGKTPRLSGTGSQHPSHLISHGEREGFAEVHFVADGTAYIAAWSVKQKSSPKGQLLYAEGDKLISDRLSTRGKSLGSSQNTISEEIESILGLDFNAFKRSVMLAQGEFAAFLKASGEERRKILEATAGIYIYDVLRQALLDKVREVEDANAEVLDNLKQIPEASHEQLTEAEVELDRLMEEARSIDAQHERVQQEKDGETQRKNDFERLQSSEERQAELLDQQPRIDALREERKNAERAKDLRSEKREYDTAKSDLEKAETALGIATTEKTDAANQVKTDQTDYDVKDRAYQAASTEHKEKTEIYTAAKLNVERASDLFAQVNNRIPKLEGLDNQTDKLSNELADTETEQAQLQELIKDAQTFVDDNPLPSDRQHRLTQANIFSSQLESQQNLLETALTNQAEHAEKVSSLAREIEKLSEIHAERLSKKTEAEDALKRANAELNKLLAAGSQDKWNARKQQAVKVQPIAQKYETMENDLADAEDRMHKLNEEKTRQDTKLEEIEAELVSQEKVCQQADKAVKRCEEALKSAMLANPINQLRQRLQPGEPCAVCGATHHPRAHVLESEDDDLLRNAEVALEQAKTEAQTAQNQRESLNTRQAATQRDMRNAAIQIEECESDIGKLRNEQARCLAEWQEIYSDNAISSDWVVEQIEKADTAIEALGEAEQAQMAASHTYDMVAQQLETCETDMAREKESLNAVEEELQNVSDAVADLQADVASTEERFWEFLPETFHGVSPNEAVAQFENKIKEVEKREVELSSTEAKLDLLNAKIETDQGSLQTLRNNRDDLQDEIDEYRHEGEAFLGTVRENTGGLETEAEINTAINALQAELQAKKIARNQSQQQLQEIQKLLTQKQTAHDISEDRHEESTKKLETARDAYFNKLSDAGFDSPQAHDNAFRDEVQVQELSDQIDAHEVEKHNLALEITELQTRFDETPFDPETLERIETKVREIAEQFQEAQQKVGAQQQRIDDLKDALEKRKALGDEIAEAETELMRWKRLQETIPKNDLRDFALEIMFRQMGNLANEQLKYLTSERYQLKVENIGDLTVIDRWNANEERPVETLSGGESFLTSLALALALADLSRGRAQLNSLFLDEGFGTLDAETLDIAIAALEGLRIQGRSIFLISHVQELTRRLPVKINVKKQGDDSLDGLFSSDIDIRG